MSLETIVTQNGASELYPRADAHTNSLLIGASSATKSASAALQISSTTQGLVLSSMTYLQRVAIGSPTTGLIVYQTNADGGGTITAGLYFYNGSAWLKITMA